MPETAEVIHLVLTLDQASRLRGLLDIATKAAGLQVAEAVVELDRLVRDADKRREVEAAAAKAVPAPEANSGETAPVA